MSAHRPLLHGGGDVRVTPWRGDLGTAYLVAAKGRPSVEAVRLVVDSLPAEGWRAALTAALPPPDQRPFLQAGFEVHERLHLLRRTTDDIPDAPDVALRRSRRRDRDAIVALDEAAFMPFWHLDSTGLDDALAATPASRLRVATTADDEVITGYAVTGRAGSRGYLQRLGVDPGRRRQGVATALVVDGLRWLRRWGAHEVLVNTQESNGGALALYETLGFRREPGGLAVLRLAIEPSPR